MAHRAVRPNRTRLVLGAVAVALVVVGVVAFALRDDPPVTTVAGARAVVTDAERFATGRAAGETLASLSEDLLDTSTRCREAAGDLLDEQAECERLLHAAGYLQVLAPSIYFCPPAKVQEARTGTAEFLRAVEVASPRQELPSPPPLPRC